MTPGGAQPAEQPETSLAASAKAGPDTGDGSFALDASPPAAAARRDHVLDAALTLFSERGYHGTTMRQIAESLGVQAPSLYNHVSGKQEILQEIVTKGMAGLIEAQRAAIGSTDDPAEQLRRSTAAHVRFHIEHKREALVGDREIASLEEPVQSLIREQRREYEHRVRNVIERGAVAGVFDVRSPKLASFAIIEMATSVVVWFRPDGPLPAETVAAEYGDMAVRIAGA